MGRTIPRGSPPYQLCHDSMLAYGDVVAASLNASLAKFACTGSTYENGILFERIADGQEFRPAQFGDWVSKTDLNPDYDKAMPDVVIITFGADDVSFVDIVTFCALGYTLEEDETEVNATAESSDPKSRIREDFLTVFPDVDAFLNRQTKLGSSYCTQANPGKVIENLFWGPIESGEIAAHYKDLVVAIQERGMQDGKVPEIVFTTYHNPLPGPSESIDCADLGDLERDEINYLITLLETLIKTITDSVSGMDGVSVAEISGVMDDHKYCTDDPWAYGLSVLWLNDASQAPFHPTPDGQAAIAKIVEQAIPSGGPDA